MSFNLAFCKSCFFFLSLEKYQQGEIISLFLSAVPLVSEHQCPYVEKRQIKADQCTSIKKMTLHLKTFLKS